MEKKNTFGIAHWTGERLERFFSYCEDCSHDPFSVDTQIAYIFHELDNDTSLGGSLLRNANTIEEAVEIFTKYYLGYDGIDERTDTRKSFARDAFERFCQ